MRPRSIGTRTILPSGAAFWTRLVKSSTSAAWMSTKKKLGASSGRLPEIWRRRLPSISASVTSRVSPRPSDSTTEGVRAPGRWMLPMASRSAVERTRGARRGNGLHGGPDAAQHDEGEDRRADEDGGDPAVAGKPDRQRGQGGSDGKRRGEIDPARHAATADAHLAKQRGGRHVAGAAERQEREGQRDQDAEHGGHGEGDGVEAALGRDRNDGRQRGTCRERHQRRQHEADDDADAGDDHDLREIDGEDEAARRAEALEGGDDAALAVEIGAHRIGDADTADDQRGQPDQRQELREALDVGGQRRRGVGAAADAPAGLRELLAGRSRIAVMPASGVLCRQPDLVGDIRRGCPAGSGPSRAGRPSTPGAAARSRSLRRRRRAR